MSVTVVDRSGEAISRFDDASRRGLDAATSHLQNEIYKAFGSSYYKGGKFRGTLGIKQSIQRKGPFRVGRGWQQMVGTEFIEALYWELGHQNTFTRKHERVQIWLPTALKNVQRMQTTYATVVKRLMDIR